MTRFAYQCQDSPLTLAEGLEEYYAANVGKVVRPRALPPESYELFRQPRYLSRHVRAGYNARR